ncbi:MAG TPA: transporter [Nitrospirota bacterium]|nr:transporter [Nitrospirota bacterium]
MFKRALCTALLALALTPAAAHAGGFCCQMSSGVQEGIYSPGGGKFNLRVDYTYSRMEKFFDGDSRLTLSEVKALPAFGGMGSVVPETMDMHRITLTGSYAPIDRLRIVVSAPWIINDMTMQMNMGMGMWMKMKMDQVSGLGDVSLIGLYRIYQDQEIRPKTAISAGAGIKFPTGDDDVEENGRRIHAHMQPGTGSWDPILTAAFMKMFGPSFLVQADMTYHISTKNDLDYEYGDTFALNAYAKYNLTDFLNLSLGANYFHSEQADDPDNNYNGQVKSRLTDYVGYTGEDSIWISPGFQVIPFENASVDFRFQYPLYYYTHGLQQVTDYRLTAGISYGF